VAKQNPLDKYRRTLPEDTIYAKHIEELNKVLQKELAKYDIDICLHIIAVKTVNDKIATLIETGEFNIEDNHIYPNQIETFAEVVASVVRNPWQSIVLLGSTQLGKTMTIILCGVLEAVLTITTGTAYKTIYLVPNSINLERQTIEDYKSFLSFYDLKIGQGNYETTYKNYRAGISEVLGNDELKDVPVWRRVGGSIKEDLKKVFETAHKKEVRLLIIVDEGHWGSEWGGNLYQILEMAKDLTTKQEGDIMLIVSATPFNFGNLETLKRIKCRTYQGYVGYAFWDGELLDDRYPLRLPKVYDFQEVENAFDIRHFRWVNRTYYRNKERFDKAKTKEEGRGKTRCLSPFAQAFQDWSWEEYKEFCEDKLIQLINNCLMTYNDRNARGFIVRFFLKKNEVTDFIHRRKHDFCTPNVVAWQDEDARTSLRTYLQSCGIAPTDLKVVFVTGSGRMGCRLENVDAIYYGADFSQKSWLAAVVQGLLGRMTGAKSELPVMFLDRKVASELGEYIRSLGKCIRNPHQRTRLGKNSHTGRSITLWVEKPDKYASEGFTLDSLFRHDLAVFLDEFVKVLGTREKLPGAQTLISPEMKKIFWDTWNAAFPMLEDVFRIPKDSFVQYSSRNLHHSPYIDDKNHAYDDIVGLRDSTKEAKTNSPLSSTREKSGTKKVTEYRRLQPQLVVRRLDDGTWKAVAIKFSFVKHLSFNTGGVVYPTEKDVAYDYMEYQDA
jgi:hypothetical protein